MATYQISQLQIEQIPLAISRFREEFEDLKARVPELPEHQLVDQFLANQLGNLIANSHILAAYSQGELLGYLGWYVTDEFRGVNRRTIYSPEYAHAAKGPQKRNIYQALYNAASAYWYHDSCKAYVITFLVNGHEFDSFWFWNGFGLLVVDAIRSLSAPLHAVTTEYSVHMATLTDVDLIADLDQDHFRHYATPPTLMVPRRPRSSEQLARIINHSISSIWLAECAGKIVGFITFEPASDGASALVNSDKNIAITSAYVMPDYRGQDVGRSILAFALQYQFQQGFQTCSVDFESVNPHAAYFWSKYFKPICFSVMRVPEYSLDDQNDE